MNYKKYNLKENYVFWPFLLTFFLTLLELFTYIGFIRSHFLLPLDVYVFISLGTFTVFLSHKKVVFSRKIPFILLFSGLLALITMIVLKSIELFKYPNFIFSKLHLELKNLPQFIALFLSWGFFFLIIYELKKLFVKQKVFADILVLLLSILVYSNVSSVAGTIEKYVPEIVVRPKATYWDKMYYLWSEPVRYLEMVKNLTDKNATIYLPPKSSPQAITGNDGIVRYFLYPRKLIAFDFNSVNGYLVASPGNELGNGDFKLWPDVPIRSDFYFLLNTKGKTYQKISSEFDPKNIPANYWALIKI